MSYESLRYVRRADKYEAAKKIWATIKPIRGRLLDTRPLGRRKDADTFTVRMVDGVVEFVLYKSPLIKFCPDDTVIVDSCGYMTNFTTGFISHVLGLNKCSRKGDAIVLDVNRDRVVALQKGSQLVLRKTEGAWEVVNAEPVYGYRINRTAANNVRARYSEFADYFEGFVKLRQEEHIEHEGSYYEQTYMAVKYSNDEIGFWQEQKELHPHLHMSDVDEGIPRKPWRNQRVREDGFTRLDSYEYTVNLMESLIRNDQDDSTKHDNFYKAAMGFMLSTASGYSPTFLVYRAKSLQVLNIFDKFTLMYNAKEVLKRVELRSGATPNAQYVRWMGED